MMRKIRLAFWEWAHSQVEKLWHWTYYKHLAPLYPPLPKPECKYYLVEGVTPAALHVRVDDENIESVSIYKTPGSGYLQ